MADRVNIEEDPFIKNLIADATGTAATENEGDGSGETTTTDGTDTSQQSSDGKQSKVDPKGEEPAAAGKDGKGSGADGKQKPGDQKQAKEGAGNSADLSLPDGTVVKAGMERRWYENMRIARDQATSWERKHADTAKQLEQATTQLQAHQATITAMGGENAGQVSDSLRLFKDLRSNPVATLQNLIAEFAAAGVDLSGVVNGLDTKAITAILDQRLKPVVDERQQQQQVHQQQQDAEQEARTFVTNHPDALTHQDVLLALAQKHPKETLENLYFALRTQVADQGYDWSKPLTPQYQARQQGGGQQTKKIALPGGGAGNVDLSSTDDVTKLASAGADASYDDIIRSAIKDVGYKASK